MVNNLLRTQLSDVGQQTWCGIIPIFPSDQLPYITSLYPEAQIISL